MPRRAIHKFPVTESVDGALVLIKMPRGAIMRHVHEQNDTICLWAEVDLDEREREERRFFLHGTGEDLRPEARTFLGTAILRAGRFVVHVYEGKR